MVVDICKMMSLLIVMGKNNGRLQIDIVKLSFIEFSVDKLAYCLVCCNELKRTVIFFLCFLILNFESVYKSILLVSSYSFLEIVDE